MYKIRTIDVWDTLIRRECHPECIKLATAAFVFIGFKNKIRPSFKSHWDIYYERIDIESHIAKSMQKTGKDEEYEVTEVLGDWIKKIFSATSEAPSATELANHELDVEIDCSFPDIGIREFIAKYPADKTIFLSDFYMNSRMLNALLENKSLTSIVSDGISSCDVGLNKRSGKLFKHVHNFFDIQPHEHIHIGDNSWSDVESPAKLGVTGISYLPEQLHAERLERESLFSSRQVLFKHLQEKTSRKVEFFKKSAPVLDAAAFQLGVDSAPLFIGFALWIAEQAVENRVDRLLFLTREGEFFQSIYSTIFPTRFIFGHALPQDDILEVSRLSTYVASMQECSLSEMNRVWKLLKYQSVEDLFLMLDLNCVDFSDVFRDLGISITQVIYNPSEDPSIKKLFQSPEFLIAANRSIQLRKNSVIKYLNNFNIKEGHNIGVVDIGWRGTIQDNLAKIVSSSHIHGMYLGLRRFINTQPQNTSKGAFGPDENRDSSKGNLFEIFSVLEMLCMSNKGSVEFYYEDKGAIFAHRSVSKEEDISYEVFSSHFQKGVSAAAEVWGPFLRNYAVTSNELREHSLSIWNDIRINPSRDLTKIFINSSQHDFFAFGDLFKKNLAPALSTIFLSLFTKKHRRIVISYIKRVQWTSSINEIQGIGKIHKFILRSIFLVANKIKEQRMKRKIW